MAEEHYPVIQITRPVSEQEKLGSKEKFWFRDQDGTRWLFKYPREGTGEHWAEKIAYETAVLFGVRCAEVQLARYECDLGAQSKSFTEPDWLKAHGNEVMAEAVEGYDENLRFGQRDHNIKNIVVAIVQWTHRNGLNRDTVISQLVSYVMLDGLIGNTDRHHENWLFYRDPQPGDFRLAPSYDHGSSLGRELQDVNRRTSRSRYHILDSGRVLKYLLNRRSGGSVYTGSHARQAPPPLLLAQLICRWQPIIARPWLERLNNVTDNELRIVIDKVPPEFMSEVTKEFAYQVVTVSKAELLRRAL